MQGAEKYPGIQTIIVVNSVVAAGGYHPSLSLLDVAQIHADLHYAGAGGCPDQARV